MCRHMFLVESILFFDSPNSLLIEVFFVSRSLSSFVFEVLLFFSVHGYVHEAHIMTSKKSMYPPSVTLNLMMKSNLSADETLIYGWGWCSCCSLLVFLFSSNSTIMLCIMSCVLFCVVLCDHSLMIPSSQLFLPFVSAHSDKNVKWWWSTGHLFNTRTYAQKMMFCFSVSFILLVTHVSLLILENNTQLRSSQGWMFFFSKEMMNRLPLFLLFSMKSQSFKKFLSLPRDTTISWYSLTDVLDSSSWHVMR
jgi:hypothetical protein